MTYYFVTAFLNVRYALSDSSSMARLESINTTKAHTLTIVIKTNKRRIFYLPITITLTIGGDFLFQTLYQHYDIWLGFEQQLVG